MSFTMSKDEHEVKITTDHTWGVEILEIDCPYKEQLEAIKEPLFRLKILLELPPSLDCVSQINEDGEQRNFFIREVFEKSLSAYCKAAFCCVGEVLKTLESSEFTTKDEE